MNEKSGRIINISKENKPVKGCTISKQLYRNNGFGISVFSLAAKTEISAESYEYHKLWIINKGNATVITEDSAKTKLEKDDFFVTPLVTPVGIKTDTGCVYTEIELRKDTVMNEILKSGEIIKLAELLPYQEGKIVNMDLVKAPNLKYVLMSFDAGTGLSEHAAPGEALVFALDGEAVIGYEGKSYTLKAGETFKFDKFGKHSVTANKRFKMALLLVLE